MKNEITERPILFSGPMIRAILEGRKTQTRRVVKPHIVQPCEGAYFDKYNHGPQWNWWTKDNKQCLDQIIKCPFGKPGEKLWVRETFSLNHSGHKSHVTSDGTLGIIYRASWNDELDYYDRPFTGDRKWRPSIHMPRWASRINLEIINIRVERLQDISEEDSKAEGIECISHRDKIGFKSYEIIHNGKHKGKKHPHSLIPNKEAKTSFIELWKSINGEGSWDKNPFVWCISFRRIK